MNQFKLNGHPHVALNNLLKFEGLCQSGGQAKLVIEEGLVLVDGVVELRKRRKIRAGQRVSFQGQDVEVVE